MTYPTAIATLDDVKSQLSIPYSDTSNDQLLQNYLNAATSWVNYFCGQIIPTVFTDEVHSGGTSKIVLHNAPILTVSTVTEYVGLAAYTLTASERGGAVSPYSYSIDNPNQGIISRVWSGLVGPFIGGINNIVVTYTAGYAVIPPDIWLALVQDIQVLYQQTQYGTGAGAGIGTEPTDTWSTVPMNAFPRLQNLLMSTRRVPGVA